MIEVALSPTEIKDYRSQPLDSFTSVVFDTLRATSSIITGLAHGVTAFVPLETLEEARARKRSDPALLLAGERRGVAPPGFDLGNSPREFKKLAGQKILLTTTNGTAALRSVAGSAEVLVGALLNIDALAAAVAESRPTQLLLVCAGTHEDFSLEDAITAGALVHRLCSLGQQELSDAAILVRCLYEKVADDLEVWLKRSRNGRALLEINKENDIVDCSRLSVLSAVGVLRGEEVVLRA
jgi:2-phosphosulfolactate phosphatase